ncbi:hypothetical protein [Oleiharenicola lentus]|uniref:hypothetical protein n=1 Tax=Oleiharenicola lentus TaxID=2508720 RepID=UPI003F67F4DF
MKSNLSPFRSQRGSAFATTIIIVGVLAVLTGSMLSYSVSERRANEHHRLVLRARNMSENISVYAAEQLTTKLYRLRSTSPMGFMEGSNKVHLPPDDGTKTDYVSAEAIVQSSMEVRAGITASTPYEYVDPALPANAGNPNIGLQVGTTTVPIISKATATNWAAGSYTSYVRQDMEVALIPLFQFGIFYNMDLEFFPGQNMSIGGPVHTNGRLMARGEVGGTATLSFGNRVTAAQGLYANGQMKVTYRKRDGTSSTGDGGDGAVNFTPVGSTTLKNLYGDSKWRDHRYGGTTETTTTLNQFKTFATSTYLGNLRTNVHGVTKLELPSIGTYSETNLATTPEDDRNNGRQIIDAPNTQRYISGAWTNTDDSLTPGLAESKISRSSGLYIIANPDDEARNGRLPDGASVTLPARSYRAWLNTINNDGTRYYREVLLPGQPSYFASASGASGEWVANPSPNAYRTDTSVGSNQILRIGKGRGPELAGTGYDGVGVPSATNPTLAPTIPTFADGVTDNYFYDLRRANGNRGYPYNRSGFNYTPRPIAKIDFDMTRFKMMIDRTLSGTTASSIYSPDRPHANTWASSVFNATANPASYNLGVGSNFDEWSDPIDSFPVSQKATLTKNDIQVTALQQTGNGAATAYAGRIRIAYTTDASPKDSQAWVDVTDASTANNDASTISLSSYTPPANATATRIRLYKAGAIPSTTTPNDLGTVVAGVLDLGSALVGGVLSLPFGGGTNSTLATTRLMDEQIIIHAADTNSLGVGSTESGAPLRRFIVAESTVAVTGSTSYSTATWTNRYTSAADERFFRYTPTTGAVTAIRVREYAAGGGGSPLSEKFIPLYQMALSNDYFVAPSNATGGGVLLSNAYTDFRIYAQGVDDTANWTFTRDTSSLSGMTAGFGRTSGSTTTTSAYTNGYGYNRLWITALPAGASTKGYVRITATRPGPGSTTLTLSKDFFVTKQSAVTQIASLTSQTQYYLSIRTAVDPFKMYFAQANPSDTPVAVEASDLVSTGSPSPWFDGVTVYIHSVDAERRAQTSGVPDRVDSGVRIWNARGPVPSLTILNRTGLTFTTNDAAYIVGHFNADGKNLVSDVTASNYSGRFPDSTDEKLACVMSDAITILSQPTFDSTYVQTAGWNDALSAHRVESSGWTTDWRTASLGGSYEGLGASASVRNMPNIATSGLQVTTRDVKFDPVNTEVSAAMLMGLVPSNHNPTGLTDGLPSPSGTGNQQYSGGAHNFPRLLEPWNTYGLYIRGSMVALFESRVAMEPWNLRVYSAPNRYWGLHEGLRTAGHDVPLEPVVLNANRKRYRETSKAQYDAQKVIIEALPRE